jgi:ABC-2 type transport system ATP-binding protein
VYEENLDHACAFDFSLEYACRWRRTRRTVGRCKSGRLDARLGGRPGISAINRHRSASVSSPPPDGASSGDASNGSSKDGSPSRHASKNGSSHRASSSCHWHTHSAAYSPRHRRRRPQRASLLDNALRFWANVTLWPVNPAAGGLLSRRLTCKLERRSHFLAPVLKQEKVRAPFDLMSSAAITEGRERASQQRDTTLAETERAVAVSIQHLSKTYPVPLARVKKLFRRPAKPPVEALCDVSLEVREGEIFGLIGRNGAGKTTLTKIVATLVQPTSGTVTVKGHDSVRDEEKVRSLVGLATAEERSFYWRLTVQQNLMFFARLYGLSDRRARRRIRELIGRFELEELARRRFGELSTGNKQRMAFARAMLASPPVLLLDEPTRSLDPLAAARMRALINTLATSDPPVSILLTSHNLVEVEELCARVAIISRGRIRAQDTPVNLRTLHRQTERVQLKAQDVTAERIRLSALAGELNDLGIREEGRTLTITFGRAAEDDRLDYVVRALHELGATILDFEAERPTLLDVMESYEREGTESEVEA